MSAPEPSGDNLAAINSATLGTTMPVVTLPDGTKVQTGTVGALIVNIRNYDKIVSQSNVDEKEKHALEASLAASMPVLKKAGELTYPSRLNQYVGFVTDSISLGLFDLFTPEEWIRGSSPGRKFVGDLAMRE